MQKEKKKKRKYVKPKITRIKLDATTAVLSTCKVQHESFGPMNDNCRGMQGGTCVEQGS